MNYSTVVNQIVHTLSTNTDAKSYNAEVSDLVGPIFDSLRESITDLSIEMVMNILDDPAAADDRVSAKETSDKIEGRDDLPQQFKDIWGVAGPHLELFMVMSVGVKRRLAELEMQAESVASNTVSAPRCFNFPEDLPSLKEAHEMAIKNEQTKFLFKEQWCDVAFAGYLIEWKEAQARRAAERN